MTAKKQGLRTAICFWPGSEAEIQGMRPDTFLPYAKSKNMTTNDRVDLVLEWLDAKVDRPDLILMYISATDTAGHIYGPNSTQVSYEIDD